MVLSTAAIGVGSVAATTASGTPIVDASAGVTTYTVGGSGVIVDPAIVVSDAAGGTYDGARVVVQNLQAGDELAFTAQHGISGSYDGSSGVLTLSGSATAVEYQAVFRSVTFSNSATSPDLSDRQVTFSLGTRIPYDDNGHFYEYVDAGTGITWHDANASANAQTYFGLQGYLVTVTSQAENDFVAEKIQGNTWIGASDDTAFSYISKDSNGYDQWHWVTGPEAGTHFWTGDENEAVSQVVTGQYANWVSGEPNDANGDGTENYAHFWFTHNSGWNDLPGSTTAWVDGYVVEYGGLDSDPAVTWSDTKTVAVDETPVVTTSAGDTDYLLGDPAVVVDPAVIADDANGDTFDGARVVIQNLHPDDVLAFTAQHSITGSYDATAGVLSLSGTATAAEYQDVFRGVTFSNANTTADATDRRITFALGSTLPSDATGHFYEYVSAGGITWHDANAAASASSYLGLQGYLATVTGQEENDFIAQKLDGSGWIGAADDTAFSYISKDSNGYDQWHWVTGPEAGTHFWTGDENEAVSQPVPGEYANWAPNEPNDHFGADSENYAHFYSSGVWNDFPGTWNVDGYVVEYGGFGGESEITWRDTKTVAVTAPPTNVAPSITVDAAAVSADEGSTAANGGTVSDADGDPVTLTASVGTVVDNGDGTWGWSFDAIDGPASGTVTITATDDDQANSSVTFDLTVENVAPTLDSTDVTDAADEGDLVSASGSFADVGVQDTHTVDIDWGDGTVESASVSQGAGSGSFAADHVYADDDTYTVTITVEDGDGGAVTATETVVVSNVAPSLTADADDTGVEDAPVSLTASFTDPGTADTHTATVDWGDGTSESVAVTGGAGSGSLAASHAYATGGIYTITVTVTDDDGGSDAVTETVTVWHHETIEVKPGDGDDDRNPINLESRGVIPVALFGTAEFDVTTVDVSTVRFGDPEDVDAGAGASPAHGGHLEDVDDDGILDLVLHFATQDTGFEDGDAVGKLVGLTDAGVPFFATDDVDAFVPGPDDAGGADADDADDDDDRRGKGNGRGR